MRIEFFPSLFLVGLGICLLFLLILRGRGYSLRELFFLALFGIYILILIGVTLFPLPVPGFLGGPFPRQPVTEILERVNLVPTVFQQVAGVPLGSISFEITGNILLTLPFGLGICLIFPVRARLIPFLALAVGLAIEATQLLVSLIIGIGYRGVDINDVLLNAAGVLLGYGLFRALAKVILNRLMVSASPK
jgi:glycopeptide antibiotics resistance protein